MVQVMMACVTLGCEGTLHFKALGARRRQWLEARCGTCGHRFVLSQGTCTDLGTGAG